MKYIIITGGVISGIGKGVTAASIGFFLSEKFHVTPIKLDGYLNVDPGTMNPKEHGEVFVLRDGAEVDMDFGHYERFLGQDSYGYQSITMGKIYQKVLEKERKGEYLGQTVQLIPHVTNLIQDTIKDITKKAQSDITIVEIGGTVGDIESELFLEAIRQLIVKQKPQDVVHIHLTYAPIPAGVKEQKTKPTQQSVALLHSKGLFPNFIFVRGQEELTDSSKRKIALFSNLPVDHIISVQDVDSIYTIPEVLRLQGFDKILKKHLKLEFKTEKRYQKWQTILHTPKTREIKIAIVGKYTNLEDSYSSVVEAIRHASRNQGVTTKRVFFDAKQNVHIDSLLECDGIIIPGGFGESAIEEMIRVIEFVRKHDLPTLGICLGLQLMILEYSRNVCGLEGANSTEFESDTLVPVISMLTSQKQVTHKGGTMRLGAQKSVLKPSQIREFYARAGRIEEGSMVSERFRHRYEVNPAYVSLLESKGLMVAGTSEKEGIVQFIEFPSLSYFVATQSHPELTSRLDNPAPLFYGLIEACVKRKYEL